jgi:hypothetical protein
MSVVLHQEGLRHLLRDPVGPVGAYIDRKARETEQHAHNNAVGRPGPNMRSGALQAHLRYGGLVTDSDGLVAYIGTDAISPRQDFPYPLAMELGMPSRAGPLPIFRSGRTQRPYGPYPFLEPALRTAFPDAR